MHTKSSSNGIDYTPDIFSSDLYLSTLGEIYFPNSQYSFEVFEVENLYYSLLVIDGKRIITTFPFLDFFHHLTSPPKKNTKKVAFIPRVSQTIERFEGDRNKLVHIDAAKEELAPFIDLTSFSDWEKYQKFLSTRKHDLVTDTDRRLRKLIREKGTPQFNFQTNDAHLLTVCTRWKTRHYEHLGGTDMFIDPRHKQFLVALQKKGLAIVSSLSVGKDPIAVVVGMLEKNIYYGWISAYDRAYSIYAPGRLLLHNLLQESFRRGFVRFDFLLGAEEYKWYYATHYQIVGPIGKPSFMDQLNFWRKKIMYWGRTYFPTPYYFLKKCAIHLLKMKSS